LIDVLTYFFSCIHKGDKLTNNESCKLKLSGTGMSFWKNA